MLTHLNMKPRDNADLDELHTKMADELAPTLQRPVLLLVDDVCNSDVAKSLLLLQQPGSLSDVLPMG